MPRAKIITADALAYMDRRQPWDSVFTSLPDAAEIGGDVVAWRAWFQRAARQTIQAIPSSGYAIFYQTDRRVDGVTQSKAGLIIEAAGQVGARIVWHKIAYGTTGISLFRPGYSHLICVSRTGHAGKPTPDVFHKGKKIYPNATDSNALEVGVGFLAGRGIGMVADPFCGRGSIGWAAARAGLDSVSIDILPEQTAAAATLMATVAEVL